MSKNYDFRLKSERLRFYNQSAWRGVNGVRKKVLNRDNNECQWCKKEGIVNTKELEIDHIIELEYCSYELALDMDNLRTLCRSCHNKRHDRFEHREVRFNKFKNDERW